MNLVIYAACIALLVTVVYFVLKAIKKLDEGRMQR